MPLYRTYLNSRMRDLFLLYLESIVCLSSSNGSRQSQVTLKVLRENVFPNGSGLWGGTHTQMRHSSCWDFKFQ